MAWLGEAYAKYKQSTSGYPGQGLLVLQALLGLWLVSTIAYTSIAAGQIPPRAIEWHYSWALLYIGLAWVLLLAAAPIVIFTGRKWGWWLEFLVLVPISTYYLLKVVVNGLGRDFLEQSYNVTLLLAWTGIPFTCIPRALGRTKS